MRRYSSALITAEIAMVFIGYCVNNRNNDSQNSQNSDQTPHAAQVINQRSLTAVGCLSRSTCCCEGEAEGLDIAVVELVEVEVEKGRAVPPLCR